MRLVYLVAAVYLALASSAYAETRGYYLTESLGGQGFRGDLARYDGGLRLQWSFAVRHGDRSYEAFGAVMSPDLFYVDCYGEECAYAAKPEAGLGTLGFDVRQRWRLLSLRRFQSPGVYERPGVFVALHGGPRWFIGSDAIDGRHGPGLGGGATLEGDLWVFGYFVDASVDVMQLWGGKGDVIYASSPSLMLGAKIGWL